MKVAKSVKDENSELAEKLKAVEEESAKLKAEVNRFPAAKEARDVLKAKAEEVLALDKECRMLEGSAKALEASRNKKKALTQQAS